MVTQLPHGRSYRDKNPSLFDKFKPTKLGSLFPADLDTEEPDVQIKLVSYFSGKLIVQRPVKQFGR